MSFTRVNRWDLLAMVAALALLFVMAMDWYTDKVGEQDRFFQHQIVPQLNNDTDPSQSALQADAAAKHEKNAWQASAFVDRLILIALLAAAGLAIGAGFQRAAGSRGPPSLSAVASIVGLFACVLLAYRILQPPGPNYAAVVKAGAPLGLVCAGLLTLGARISTITERRRPAAATPGPEAAPADPPASDAPPPPAPAR